ncbi:hypothetical protein AURDEDRAFT_110207 [Auricularia subglabra TFB-10046 SS5]|nr:hypothetical protein AURDEDRAFT_110207 [Auricularia subglabra TFB-10046 SS5]
MHSRSLLLTAVAPLAALAFDPAGLFPIAIKDGYTTYPSVPKAAGAALVALDDAPLGVIKISRGLNHTLVDAPGDAPAGTKAWQINYPKGSYNPSADDAVRGGIGFYFPGPTGHDWSDPATNEILFSYAVYFPAGFNFVKGGKLPGPYGGATEDEAYACSGGRQDDREGCFDLRLMWRTSGAGEIYAYVPISTDGSDPNTKSFSTLKNSVIDGSFGVSVARGAFTFATGAWTVVAERVKLNTVGQTDGELELFVNGESVIHATNLQIRTKPEVVFRGVHFQSFFGGSDNTWATPTDQQVFFAGISGATLEPGASPASGKEAYPLGQSSTIDHNPTDTDTGDAPSETGGTGAGGDGGTGSAGALRASGALAALVAVVMAALL